MSVSDQQNEYSRLTEESNIGYSTMAFIVQLLRVVKARRIKEEQVALSSDIEFEPAIQDKFASKPNCEILDR